jgi:hypothetical protein
VIHIFFYGLLYSSFTGIYFACGGRNKSGHLGIYRLIDWRHPRTILLVACAAGVVMPILWFALYGYYRLKIFLAKKCGCTGNVYSLGPEMVKQADEQTQTGCDEAEACDTLKEGDISSNLV